MRRILKSKKGVTILEGLIALTLLALVATGTFAVLLSTSRKSSTPDIREEMVLAVERASQRLQAFTSPLQSSSNPSARGIWEWEDVLCDGDDATCAVAADHIYAKGLCGNDPQMLATGGENAHRIDCMLPPICDRNQSEFWYELETVTPPLPRLQDQATLEGASTLDVSGQPLYQVDFYIKCNGFTL